MKKRSTWYKNKDFWRTLHPVLFTQRRRAMAVDDVNNIISLLKLKPGAKVLDLCCGVGRHTLEFAQKGYVMTGVDLTTEYVREARKKVKQKGLDVEFVVKDMRRFRRPNTYNAIINLFTSFGYFKSQHDDLRVAKNMYDSLKRGGSFLIETMGKEILTRIFRERDWSEVDGTIIMEERKPSSDWGTLENRWIILRGNRRKEFTFKLRIYSAVELSTLLRQAGFRKAHAYGDLAGAPYDQKATRLIVVARK